MGRPEDPARIVGFWRAAAVGWKSPIQRSSLSDPNLAHRTVERRHRGAIL
jgi:hypothetical protein